MQNDDIGMKIWRVVYPPLIYIIVNIIVQAVMIVIITANYNPGAVITDGQTVVNNLTESVNKYSNLVGLISALITIPIIYRFSKMEFLKDMRKKMTKSYLYLIPFAFLANTGLSRMISLLPSIDIFGNYTKVEQNLFSGSIAIQALSLIVIIPLMEEMIFRGLVYKRIKEYTGSIYTGAIVSSLMFGLYHFNLAQGIYGFLLGLIFIFVYEKYKNILAPIVMHMLCNLFAVILSYSGISAFFSESIFAYIILMVLELAGIFGFIILINRRKI